MLVVRVTQYKFTIAGNSLTQEETKQFAETEFAVLSRLLDPIEKCYIPFVMPLYKNKSYTLLAHFFTVLDV